MSAALTTSTTAPPLPPAAPETPAASPEATRRGRKRSSQSTEPAVTKKVSTGGVVEGIPAPAVLPTVTSTLDPITPPPSAGKTIEKPAAPTNHRGRYSHILERGKDHQGKAVWNYYEIQTRHLDRKAQKAFDHSDVHVQEVEGGRMHRLLDAAKSGTDGWKRVDADTVLRHNYLAVFDFDSTIDEPEDEDDDATESGEVSDHDEDDDVVMSSKTK